MTTIGDITAPKVEQSGPPPTGEFTYVDIGSIDNRTKRITEPKRLPVNAAPSRARQSLASGDVLVSMTRPNLNAVALVPSELDGAIGSTGFHVLRANERTEPRWLYYAVQNRSFVQAMSAVVQGALYPAVRPKDIRGFAVDPPPLPEQRVIVAEIEKQFSRLDEAVAGLQRVKANLKRYKAAVLKSAAAGRLVERASNWVSSRLDKVAAVVDPHPSHRTPPTVSGGVPYIGIGDFTGDGLVARESARKIAPEILEEHRNRYRLCEGDFIFGKIGTIGRPVMLTGPFEYALSANVVLIQPNRSIIHPSYLFAYMASPLISSLVSTESRATTQAAFGIKRIRDLEIPIPPLAEQHRIVAEVDRLLSIAREAEVEVDANLKRAQGLRQAILSRAFCGGLQ